MGDVETEPGGAAVPTDGGEADRGEVDGGEGGACWTELEAAIAAVLATVGPGDVLTYGEVAKEAGYPRHARAVGRFLSTHDGYPWWRIVNAVGRLVPGHEREQSAHLVAEGVQVARGHVVGMRRARTPGAAGAGGPQEEGR
jgi:methylated-DNA-protein-cysteine methyltransferase-like protein